MSGNFHDKVLNFEIIPPKEIWSKIAEQLDEEFKPDDTHLSQKLHDFEINPPSFLRDKVLSQLNSGTEYKAPTTLIKFPLRRVAIAAAIIGLIATSLVYSLQSDSVKPDVIPTATVTDTSFNGKKSDPSASAQNNEAKLNSGIPDPSYTLEDKLSSKKQSFSDNRYSKEFRNNRYARLSRILKASNVSPISVYAPPIYDGDGNIILDENLVSAPDDNYIIVTSPNGEQTKVSRKFLKMLLEMHGRQGNGYMNSQSAKYKARFEEWRSKLLQQPSYIPTANNFLDIMELKEILQEN